MIGRWLKPSVVEDQQPRGFDDFELQLGDVMRGERATLGKSLLDVQRELKIKATYISAIENTDPSVFETQGFIAGFVRSYARYLDLDPDWAFERFCAESGFIVAHGMSPAASSARKPVAAAQVKKYDDPFSDPNATFVPRTESFFARIEPGAVGSLVVLIALVGTIGYGGWSVLQEIQKVHVTPVDQAPGVASSTSTLGGGDDVQLATLADTAGLQAPSAEALDRLYRPQALETPVLVPRDGPIASLDPRSSGSLIAPSSPVPADTNGLPTEVASAGFETFGTTPIQVVEGSAPEVALVAVRPAWVRVSAADGSVIFEKILNAGERYVLPATEEAPLLRTGNGGGVYFAVNGQAFGPAGRSGSVVKNIALSETDISEAFAAVDLNADDHVSEMFQVAHNAALAE
jgi:cytoskeletal protein RodZ